MANATAEKNEFQHSEASKKIFSSQPPLLELPIPITELILERLPLPDYIRFASVCTKWHSIQKQHRIRHSPLPPPMEKSFPCLIHLFSNRSQISLHCYSPSDQKCFRFSIPETYMINLFAISHGWFFLLDKNLGRKQISLLNPISKSQIQFPPLMVNLSIGVKGFLSASPLSSDCIALIMDVCHYRAFLYWFGQKQSKWTSLDLPIDFPCYCDVVYCAGKFYCMVGKIFVIDPIFTTPTINELNMDCAQFPRRLYNRDQTLVESNGEVLMIDLIHYPRRFDVFKVDFSKKIWVKLESIGDRALFVGTDGSCSVLANDIDCRSNCVYLLECYGDREIWSVFDMGTMKWSTWSNGPPPPYKEYDENWFCSSVQWFLPSLDYNI